MRRKEKVNAMKYADLHIHSSYSDGIYSPEEIVESAKTKGIKYLSITDHDSIVAQYITKEKLEGITVIPGIELSTAYNDLELHILGYFIDVENPQLKEMVCNLNKERIKRVESILGNLKKHDIHIDFEELSVDLEKTIGRSHVANAMVSKGYFDSYKNAFRSYLVKGKPAYERGFRLHYREALEVIISSGGIPVLAHPAQIYRKIEIENIIRELKCFGLGGLEVYHPSHSCCDINKFHNLAKKYKLAITGGSDYHGRCITEELGIGTCGINEELMMKFLKCCNNSNDRI